mgnify:CR=1 FL=1
MTPRKKINLLFTIIVIFVSSVAILLSDDSSKLTENFKKPIPTEIPIETGNTLGVFSTKAPIITPVFQDNPTIIENNKPVVEGYRVVKVVDGDTLDVDIDKKIERLRLIGIDTPETVDPRKSVQCFGIEASSKSKELLEGKFVTLESDDTQSVRDKYKRLLVYVFLPDGTNFNKFMIEEGYAYEYTYDSAYKYQSEFKEAQVSAQSSNKGLWNPSTCSGVR